MDERVYVGQTSQIYGVEEHRMIGGKGDGMRLLQVRNGKGLEFTISADRCADISRLSFRGDNYGFFSGSGYVAPAYYDASGKFLDSFTAGFLATCGLENIGSACEEEGIQYPMHGSIGNIPASQISYRIQEEAIVIHAVMHDERLFGRKFILEREIECSLIENRIRIRDTVRNEGTKPEAVCILYHLNMGYPLLSEKAELYIPSKTILPRDVQAVQGLNAWNQMEPPQEGFEEQCYVHQFQGQGLAALYNPTIKKGAAIRFDPEVLPAFTQWKMMGVHDYALGLEPGNASVNGRLSTKEENKLQYIPAYGQQSFEIIIEMIDGESKWQELKMQG